MLLLSLKIRSPLFTYNPFNPSKRHSILFLQRRILQKNLNLLNIREQEWNYFRRNKPFERNHSVRQTTVTSLTENILKWEYGRFFVLLAFTVHCQHLTSKLCRIKFQMTFSKESVQLMKRLWGWRRLFFINLDQCMG